MREVAGQVKLPNHPREAPSRSRDTPGDHAEIRQFELPASREQKVGGLDVPVNQPAAVQIGKAVKRRGRRGGTLALGETATCGGRGGDGRRA